MGFGKFHAKVSDSSFFTFPALLFCGNFSLIKSIHKLAAEFHINLCGGLADIMVSFDKSKLITMIAIKSISDDRESYAKD
jgi:hypothetical protein